MIRIDGSRFTDAHGRTLILRGANVAGSTKLPISAKGTHCAGEDFFNHREVSFVGRPFPLSEADEHFTRLKRWGLTFLRFLVTWEAVEHAGPGLYDEAYLDYLTTIVEKAGEYDMQLFIDPHQDVWSRLAGGDGAPGWTFEAVGMDVTRFKETGAAIVQQVYDGPFPRMIWPTNNTKLAASTLFTLFFGGNDFAPQSKVDGVPVQEYLQSHYIESIKRIAERLKGFPHVVGYDSLNEPYPGYIGWADLMQPHAEVLMGPIPSPLQSMALGAGAPQEVDVWDGRMGGPSKLEARILNPNGVSVWMNGHEPIWKAHGVWDIVDGEPTVLKPDHFSHVNGRPITFNQDYLRPFANRFAREIRSVDPEAIIFVETVPGQELLHWGPDDAQNIASAPHWYDEEVLFMKTYHPDTGFNMRTREAVHGEENIRKSFSAQLNLYRQEAAEFLGGVPTLIGEIGIPFDLDNKRAFQTDDFSGQVKAYNRTMVALEDTLLNATLWNYTPDNNNAHGDNWNDEDLSIFSPDQQDDPADIDSGGRALTAVVRPYALKIAGTPERMTFEMESRTFEFTFRHDTAVTEPTEIFVPEIQYPAGFAVEVSDGDYEVRADEQLLIYRHTTETDVHRIRIVPQG